MPEVATVAIEAKFDRPRARLDHPGASHSRDATGRCESGRDFGLEPAGGGCAFGHRVGEGPRLAACIPLAAHRALGWIARSHRKTQIIAAWPIVTDLPKCLRAERQRRGQRAEPLAASSHV